MREISIAILSLLLGTVFVLSSAPKLRHPRGFVLSVLEYRVLPEPVGYFYAWLLPPLELLLSIFLLTGTSIHYAAVITDLLLLSFILAIGINIARGRDIDCNCFGSRRRQKVGWTLLLQDISLFLFAGILIALTSTYTVLETWSVYHVLRFVSESTFLPLLVNVGLSLCIASFLWTSQSRKRKRMQGKLYGRY